MSATGFHPDPSAKAPWTRTMVLTAAYAGDDAARAAPVRRARIKRFICNSMTLRGRIDLPKGQDRADCDCVQLQQGFAAGEMGRRGQVAWHHPEPLISASGQISAVPRCRLFRRGRALPGTAQSDYNALPRAS